MNHSKFLAVALTLVMIVPVVAVTSFSDESSAAVTTNSETISFSVVTGNAFELKVTDQFWKGYDFTSEDKPSWVSFEERDTSLQYSTILIKGTAPSAGKYTFTWTKWFDSDHENGSRQTLILNVSDSSYDVVNYSNFGIDRQLDDYLNPFRYGGTEQTLTTSNDKSIRLKPGYYDFKFSGWWFSEGHSADLTGETYGLYKDSDGNWVGILDPGRYEFTVAINKDNLTFKFYIQVNEKKLNLNYHSENQVIDGECVWGEPFSLLDTSNGSYTLEGWYDTDGFRVGLPGDNYTVYTDTDLYAKWISNVIVMDSDGTVLSIMEVEKDSTCTLPTVTKEGYEFSHWSTEADGDAVISDGTSPYKPTGDIVLYPVFTDDLRFPIPEFSLVTEG